MGIFWIASDYLTKVCYRLLVHFDVLVSFSTLVYIQNIPRCFLDTLSEREDSLFEFFQARVGEPNMVIDVVLVLGIRAAVERALEEGSDLSKFLICVVVYA